MKTESDPDTDNYSDNGNESFGNLKSNFDKQTAVVAAMAQAMKTLQQQSAPAPAPAGHGGFAIVDEWLEGVGGRGSGNVACNDY